VGSDPPVRGPVRGWALAWALAAASAFVASYANLEGRRAVVINTWLIIAAASFGLGAMLAALSRASDDDRSRAGLEGAVWGIAFLAMLLLWVYWVPREVLGKPGEVNEVWTTPNHGGESHGRSIHFAPELIRAVETFVLFGVVGGLLSTVTRLGRRAVTSPLRCVGGALAWGLGVVAAVYPLILCVYLLPHMMSDVMKPISEFAGIIIGGAMAGAIGGVIVGAIGESLTHPLIPR